MLANLVLLKILIFNHQTDSIKKLLFLQMDNHILTYLQIFHISFEMFLNLLKMQLIGQTKRSKNSDWYLFINHFYQNIFLLKQPFLTEI
jgi:hypothetical protein